MKSDKPFVLCVHKKTDFPKANKFCYTFTVSDETGSKDISITLPSKLSLMTRRLSSLFVHKYYSEQKVSRATMLNRINLYYLGLFEEGSVEKLRTEDLKFYQEAIKFLENN